MRNLKLAAALAGAITVAGVGFAIGQAISTGNEFATQTSGKTVVGVMQMIWNASLGYAQPVSLASPLPVGTSGTTGLDFSANRPTLPNVGANFAASGPYASYVLTATVAASPTRNNVDIENLSGAQIAVVRDDGAASGGAAPANASVFALGGGASSGAQGGAWSSTTFKGRIQVYAPVSGAVVAVMVD